MPAIHPSETRNLRLALVAMPWSQHDRPSAAISALAPYVARCMPSCSVSTYSAFVDVAAELGLGLYRAIADNCYEAGELLYFALLYPEKRADVQAWFVEWAANNPDLSEREAFAPIGVRSWDEVGSVVLNVLMSKTSELAGRLAASKDAVGLTTCFGQLAANLLLARGVKALNPSVRVVLGGSTLSGHIGPAVLREYPFVDYIVQGEGERPLVASLSALAEDRSIEEFPGVVSRSAGEAETQAAPLSEMGRLDDLPLPDYDEYAVAATKHDIGWVMPLEASRGCWWDRTKRTGDRKATCFFCNLNVQWGGYREKSVQRVAAEAATLSDRYSNPRLHFVDNIIRAKGAAELASALSAHGRDYEIFYELRSNISSYEIMLLWEAGLTAVQFGIEGLSTAFLRRIGKGTSTVQNLRVMRTCAELGIRHNGNLITEFPGATAEEVDETRKVILRHALAYQPLNLVAFELAIDSTVFGLPEEFGIANIRNPDVFRVGLPFAVWERMPLFNRDYDVVRERVSWEPVSDAQRIWSRHHQATKPVLEYRDCGTFLLIRYGRNGGHAEGIYRGVARDVYLRCMEAPTLENLLRQSRADPRTVKDALQEFVECDLMFTEGERYLSLAMAPTPMIAARRMRADHLCRAELRRTPSSPARVHLPTLP